MRAISFCGNAFGNDVATIIILILASRTRDWRGYAGVRRDLDQASNLSFKVYRESFLGRSKKAEIASW